ncbi:MAG: LPS-assembly lipoprotein LptE [Methylococcaceae bacterium]
MLIKKSAVLVIALLLSACGYHLRGALDLPENLKKVYLEGGSPQFREEFNRTLRSSAAQLAKSPEEAGIVVRVLGENEKRRALSLSSRGRSNELELYYRLEYELSDSGNALATDRQLVEIRREYFNDQQDIVAKDYEESVIKTEMYQQAVRTIFNRARVVLSKNAK